jgi:hypothetical protein
MHKGNRTRQFHGNTTDRPIQRQNTKFHRWVQIPQNGHRSHEDVPKPGPENNKTKQMPYSPNSTCKYKNLNPSAPSIKGLIKLHKPDQPIRKVVNWKNAPAYKLSRSLTQKIKELSPLPYPFNVRNSTQLIQELKTTPILPSHTFASLDISNMYTNILVAEARWRRM